MTQYIANNEENGEKEQIVKRSTHLQSIHQS